MSGTESVVWIAFARARRIAMGAPRDVAVAVKRHVERHAETAVLVFDARTSAPVEIDLRGGTSDVLARIPDPAAPETAGTGPKAPRMRKRGRPRLGVVAREVTLLPRHWAWLAEQPGGASVALRRLVEQARRTHRDADRLRHASEAAYRFMHAMAGDRPGYEEAMRALFAGNLAHFRKTIARWPRDIRAHALILAEGADTRIEESGSAA